MAGGCDLSSCNICSTALLCWTMSPASRDSVLSSPLPESSRLPQCQAQGGAPCGLSNKPLCDWADPQPTLRHCPSALYFGLHLHLLPATNLLSPCWLTKCHHKQILDCGCGLDQYHIRWDLANLGKCRENPAGRWAPPLTATSTDCMERSHGGFRALGLVAYQKVVSAAKAPKPMSVLVGRLRTYCRKSTSSGIRKYRNSSWACMVLCWWFPKLNSARREKCHGHSREAGLFSRIPGPALSGWLTDPGINPTA